MLEMTKKGIMTQSLHGNDRGETDIGIEDINDICPECGEELGVMNLLGFGE